MASLCACVSEQNMITWPVTSCSSERTRRFEDARRLQRQSWRLSKTRNQQNHVTALSFLPSSTNFLLDCLFDLYSSETSGSLRTTQHYNPEGGILHAHLSEKLSPNSHEMSLLQVWTERRFVGTVAPLIIRETLKGSAKRYSFGLYLANIPLESRERHRILWVYFFVVFLNASKWMLR
jgi:hypothetical protein